MDEGHAAEQRNDSAMATQRPSSPWVALAPPLAWWWLMLAGAGALVVGLGTLQVIQHFARPLGLVVLGVTLAASLAPIVDWLERKIPRKLAVVLIYLLLVLVLIGLGWWWLPGLIQQASDLRESLPAQLEAAEQWLTRRFPLERGDIAEIINSRLNEANQDLWTMPLTFATTLTGTLVDIVAVLFISLYGLLEAPKLQRFVLSFVPSVRRDRTQAVLVKVIQSMGGYVRGVLLSGLLVGIVTYAGLRLIGVNYAAVLALISGLLEIVPIIGPLIAGVIVLGVALFQSLQLALYALILMLVIQQIEGNIITPLVMRQQTQVNELLVLVAILAGSAAGGVFGILVAVPLTAAITVIVQEVLAPMVRRWAGAAPRPDLQEED